MEFFPKPLTRRHFLQLSALGGLSYMRYAEPRWLEVGTHDIPTGQPGGTPIRLLHLADLHASDVVSLKFIEGALKLALAQKPDLICLTGDFITTIYSQFEEYAQVLSVLAKAAPTYATLGNHDGGSWSGRRYHSYSDSREVRKMLATTGIELLHNTHRDLLFHGRKLRLVGMGDLWSEELLPAEAFPREAPAPDVFTVALAHNPDSKTALAPYPWDLMLSGHTHGGQLLIPLIGAPFAPVRDKRFVQGLHRWENRWIHITKGVGNLHGLRINCRPEVSLLRLV